MDEHYAVVRSRFSYKETLGRLLTAINAAGNSLFALVEQADAARSVGLDLRPTALIVFGNPKGGTPLMAAHPLFALELPLKLLLWEDGDTVQVAHTRMRETARRYGIDPADPRIASMDKALETLAATVV
ncbi:MAG TPA: DUF302 domain-containing protein [Candidatus Limnocylindria bacterium]|nr:DUF302 domain-containing protein [Candidatus Limnocylindria bacterium]